MACLSLTTADVLPRISVTATDDAPLMVILALPHAAYAAGRAKIST